MQDIKYLIERIAPTKTPVLFLGEQGAGKSYYARYLHEKSSAKPGLLCEIPAKTLKQELLTQLLSQKPETLFFSEISEMTAEMQKQVFVLSTEFPVRLLASSTHNLEALKDAGFFLPDLFGVLSALPIVIPPLRTRSEDIVPLAHQFLAAFAAEFGKKDVCFSPESEKALCSNNWQGNVRELRDCVRFACQTVIGGVIECAHLRLNQDSLVVLKNKSGRTLKEALDAFKKEYILQVLAEAKWNQTKAAKILNIQRTYLSRLIRELNID